jgi:restriction endonuclease Mrr
MKINPDVEKLVLVTLSFFEPMTFSQIILDFDKDLISNFPNFDKEELIEVLDSLEKKKLINRIKIDKEIGWIRVHIKRPWWKRFF